MKEEPKITRFILNEEYYTGEMKMMTPPPGTAEQQKQQTDNYRRPKGRRTKIQPVIHPMIVKLNFQVEPETKNIKYELGMNKTIAIHLSTFGILHMRVSTLLTKMQQ